MEMGNPLFFLSLSVFHTHGNKEKCCGECPDYFEERKETQKAN